MRKEKQRPVQRAFKAAFCAALCCLLTLSGCGTGGETAVPVALPATAGQAVPKERAVAPNPYSGELTAEAAAALQETGVLTESLPMEDAVSRAMFIRLAVGALGAELPEEEADVPGEAWYAPYVKAGYAMGLFADSGEDMSFTPTDGFFMGSRGYEEMERPISRYDAAAIVAHAVPEETTGAVSPNEDELARLPALLRQDLRKAAEFLPPSDGGGFRGDDSLSFGEAVVCAWKLMTDGSPQPAAVAVPPVEETLRQDGRIVHAGGRIAGTDGKNYTYTNSAEALVNAYRAGSRIMEFDFMQTSDGHLAGIHDWMSTVSSSITDGTPLSLEEWLQVKVYGRFTPLCLESLAGFMREHPDLYIVTDVKDRNAAAAGIIAETCPDLKDRFIIQIYKDSEYDEIAALGFRHIIYTLYNLPPADKRDTKHLAEFAAEHPLLGYTYPEALRKVWRYTDRMRKIGVMLFVHTINDQKEIDACYSEGIDAVYTDNV